MQSENFKKISTGVLLLFFLAYVFLIMINQVKIYSSDFTINDDVRNLSYFFHQLDDPSLFENDLLAQVGNTLGSPAEKFSSCLPMSTIIRIEKRKRRCVQILVNRNGSKTFPTTVYKNFQPGEPSVLPT